MERSFWPPLGFAQTRLGLQYRFRQKKLSSGNKKVNSSPEGFLFSAVSHWLFCTRKLKGLELFSGPNSNWDDTAWLYSKLFPIKQSGLSPTDIQERFPACFNFWTTSGYMWAVLFGFFQERAIRLRLNLCQEASWELNGEEERGSLFHPVPWSCLLSWCQYSHLVQLHFFYHTIISVQGVLPSEDFALPCN